MSIRISRLIVLVPALVSCAILWNNYAPAGVTYDGVTYLQIARNILHGKGLGWQALWASPLHSILIATVSYLTGVSDLLAATSLVSPVMAFLLVIAVYKLTELLFDRKTALVASLIVAISPHLLLISFSAEPEITYTALITLSLALLTRAVTGNSITYAAVAGVSFALAYLARSEGFLILVFVLAMLLIMQGRHCYKTLVFRQCVIITVLFFITASPYLHFLHKNYGAFVISPKASYVMCWLKSVELHYPDAENPDIWGLNSEGRLKWQEPRGIKELLVHLLADPQKNLLRYLENISNEIPGKIPNGSGMERYPQLIPLYLLLAAVASLFLKWGEFHREKRAILLSPLLILFVLPLFNGGWWKYLVPYFPIVVILASKGITGCSERLASYAGKYKLPAEALISASAVVAIAISYYAALHPQENLMKSGNAHNEERGNFAEATKELADAAFIRFGPNRNYMAKWSKSIYYLNGFWTAFPLAPLEQVLTYAREHKVDYLVIESKNPKEKERLKNPPPGLQLVDIVESQEYVYMLAFYRLTD